MNALDLNPKTQTVAAAAIKPGHIVMESHDHPAQVTRVAYPMTGRISIFARFLWQASNEPEWKLGTFGARDGIEKAVR